MPWDGRRRERAIRANSNIEIAAEPNRMGTTRRLDTKEAERWSYGWT